MPFWEANICCTYVVPLKQKTLESINYQGFALYKCGLDGTRTRDLRRDRAAF